MRLFVSMNHSVAKARANLVGNKSQDISFGRYRKKFVLQLNLNSVEARM